MTEQVQHAKIDDLPDRREHLKKIALRIAMEQPEFAANDPDRNAEVPEGGYRVVEPTETGSGRGPHG
jgi:hypothetical protein